MSVSKPIGIFDSGVGGLSVAGEIKRLLPGENMLYFADSAYCPYGTKKPEEIFARSVSISRFLIQQGAKMLVVACNTASVAGLDRLRETFAVPIVGMEPAVKPAAEATGNACVGVLATGVTLNGDRFSTLLQRFASHVKVVTQPCPGLVELVESGDLSGPRADQLLDKYLRPLLSQGVDTVVLGCTHYPFLRKAIQEKTGPEITIIDTGEAVARQVARVLSASGLLCPKERPGKCSFFTSGDPRAVGGVISKLLNEDGIIVDKIDLN